MDPLLKVGLTEKDLDIPVTERDRKRMHASTPHGGRYANYTEPLEGITSEFQLVKRRLDIEVEYLIALGDEFQNYKGTRKKLIEHPFGDRQRDALRGLYTNFSEKDYVRFKKIERQTDHDVVAMIVLGLYNMGDVIDPELMERALHFGRTSSDMDSNVFSLVMQEILATYYLPAISGLQNMFIGKSKEWHKVPEDYERPFTVIVGQTHEQPAVPTPLKKVAANIASAINQEISRLVISGPKGNEPFRLYGKLGGAVGNDESMVSAYPDHDWQPFYRKFIEGLDLEYQPVCDQDESNMKLLDLLGIIKETNLPLLKWCDDYSSYCSRWVLTKATSKSARGSSIMPQKINPWKTEGAETFIEFANAELGVFDLLARQRKQGDLRRSVLKRYISVPMENIVIAIGRIGEDFEKSYPNYTGIEREFAAHPEISSASVQSILRANGVPGAYEMMVEKTKGREVTPQMMESIVDDLVRDKVITNAVGDDIKKVFIHEKNIGDALKIADDQLAEASETIEKIRKVYDIHC